jgi:hypothetical protein
MRAKDCWSVSACEHGTVLDNIWLICRIVSWKKNGDLNLFGILSGNPHHVATHLCHVCERVAIHPVIQHLDTETQHLGVSRLGAHLRMGQIGSDGVQ